MAYKDTVAIIGAATTLGAFIAKGISSRYRLLLMDTEHFKLLSVQNEILAGNNSAETDIFLCCKSASWEADIIIVANSGNDLREIAVKMQEVSTCKTVLHFTYRYEDIDALQQLLLHAKVVTILSSEDFTDAFICGADKEAIDIAKTIIETLACHPQTSESN